MKDLKNKNINELIENIENITEYLYTHNKNYNEKQYENILDLIDNITELKERL